MQKRENNGDMVSHVVERENDGDSGVTHKRDRERITVIVVSHAKEREQW